MLGNLYYNGKGVEKSNLLAYKWLSLAIKNNPQLAKIICKNDVFYIINLRKVFLGDHLINCKRGLPNGNHPAPRQPIRRALSLGFCFRGVYFRFNLQHIQGFHLFNQLLQGLCWQHPCLRKQHDLFAKNH